MKIIVSRHELRAALLFASNDESRLVLNSVLLEAFPGKKPLLVSTDGRRLAVIETEAEQAETPNTAGQILLRSDFLKPICALSQAVGSKLFAWIAFEANGGSERVSVEFIGTKTFLEVETNAMVEAEYPDWRKVLPPKRAKERAGITELGINAEIMADFARAGKLLGADPPLLAMNLAPRSEAIEVRITAKPNFCGILMQADVHVDAEFQPEFTAIVKDLAPPKEPEKAPEPEDKVPSITIDMDLRCKRCGRGGAERKSGVCLDCVTRDIKSGKLDHIIHPKGKVDA